MRTTIRLSEELLKRAKGKAARDGRTLTSLVEEGLTQVLGDTRKKHSPKRVIPRISSATGGLMPGLDPIKIAIEVEELDDLASLRRAPARP
jgi:hypothetical protein